MENTLKAIHDRFIAEVGRVDDVAQILLKGHLVMEGVLTEALETFALHGEFVEDARLQMSQKIAFCRAISTSDQENKMWGLISQINTVRNALSHSLEPGRRSKAIAKLRGIYEEQFGEMPDSTKGIPNGIEKDFSADAALCLYAVGGALGFLHAHLEEVKRLKAFVQEQDAALNKGAMQRSEKPKA